MSKKKTPQGKPKHLKAVGKDDAPAAPEMSKEHEAVARLMPFEVADAMRKDPEIAAKIVELGTALSTDDVLQQILMTGKDDLSDIFVRNINTSGASTLLANIFIHWISYAKPEDYRNVAMMDARGSTLEHLVKGNGGPFYMHFRNLSWKRKAIDAVQEMVKAKEAQLLEEKRVRLEAEKKALAEQEAKMNPKLKGLEVEGDFD